MENKDLPASLRASIEELSEDQQALIRKFWEGYQKLPEEQKKLLREYIIKDYESSNK